MWRYLRWWPLLSDRDTFLTLDDPTWKTYLWTLKIAHEQKHREYLYGCEILSKYEPSVRDDSNPNITHTTKCYHNLHLPEDELKVDDSSTTTKKMWRFSSMLIIRSAVESRRNNERGTSWNQNPLRIYYTRPIYNWIKNTSNDDLRPCGNAGEAAWSFNSLHYSPSSCKDITRNHPYPTTVSHTPNFWGITPWKAHRYRIFDYYLNLLCSSENLYFAGNMKCVEATKRNTHKRFPTYRRLYERNTKQKSKEP